jgi:hypothetical protein
MGLLKSFHRLSICLIEPKRFGSVEKKSFQQHLFFPTAGSYIQLSTGERSFWVTLFFFRLIDLVTITNRLLATVPAMAGRMSLLVGR